MERWEGGLRGLYRSVERVLESVRFAEIWPSFAMTAFALYDADTVCLKDGTIPVDHRFRGNTAIDFEGCPLAIWNVAADPPADVERFAADLVHEMFHAFQNSSGERRYPDDLSLLRYPDSVANYRLKHAENQLLLRAYASSRPERKRALLTQYMAARKYRARMLGELIWQEYRAETIEGMAEYAGLSALRQISPEAFFERVSACLLRLQTASGVFFDPRRLAYDTGALLCLTLSDAAWDWRHAPGATDVPLFELVSADVAAAEPALPPDDGALSSAAETHILRKRARFDAFLSQPLQTVTGVFDICGYDPMNMLRLDDRILCSHFVMLDEGMGREPLFVNGPVLLHLQPDSVRRVIAYQTAP